MLKLSVLVVNGFSINYVEFIRMLTSLPKEDKFALISFLIVFLAGILLIALIDIKVFQTYLSDKSSLDSSIRSDEQSSSMRTSDPPIFIRHEGCKVDNVTSLDSSKSILVFTQFGRPRSIDNSSLINKCLNSIPSGLVRTYSVSNSKYFAVEGYGDVKDAYQPYLLKDWRLIVLSNGCNTINTFDADNIIQKYGVAVNGVRSIELDSELIIIRYHINPDAGINRIINLETNSDYSYHIICDKSTFTTTNSDETSLNCYSFDAPSVIDDIETVLVELNNWDKSELMLLNETDNNQTPSGETTGWVDSHVDSLRKYGIKVWWDKDYDLYRIQY